MRGHELLLTAAACALLAVHAAASSSRQLRVSRAVRGRAGRAGAFTNSTAAQEPDAAEDQAEPCGCDCCLAANADSDNQAVTVAAGANGLRCVPRSIAAASGSDAGDGGCASVCAVPDADQTAFDSQTTKVDYARYCLTACHAGTAELNIVCIGRDDDDGVPAAGSSAPGLHSLAEKAMAQVRARVKQAAPDPATITALMMAKGEMEQARLSAQGAGQAARMAKESYEYVLQSSEAMAEQASKATIAEIQREAQAQAQRAMVIRLKYEQAARDKATKAAIAAATVYKNARMRDIALSGSWSLRAGEYATAAGQRQGMATSEAARAEGFRRSNDFDRARSSMFMAHQSMDQAKAFADQAKAAHEQAVAISQTVKWYDYAEKAIAANTLAASMPPDVKPPIMPPLP